MFTKELGDHLVRVSTQGILYVFLNLEKMKKAIEVRGIAQKVAFAAIGISRISPSSLRSSVRKPRPAAIASRGLLIAIGFQVRDIQAFAPYMTPIITTVLADH